MSCKFQQDWLSAPMFKDWIQRHENNYKTSCKVCQNAIDLSNMGRGALISHSQGKGHKEAMALVAGPTMLQFVKTKQVSKEIESVKDTLLTVDEQHSSQQGRSVPGQQQFSMKTFTTNESVMKAEIMWSVKSVMAHFSFSASTGIGDLFKKVFLCHDWFLLGTVVAPLTLCLLPGFSNCLMGIFSPQERKIHVCLCIS